MKRIISLLCVACLVLITACSDDKEVGPIFDSVLTPDFTFDDGAEIIAGVDAVQFTDNSTAKGTEISGYFWHFGFAGLGNWSEEAAPDPVMYKEAGEYVVTLTAPTATAARPNGPLSSRPPIWRPRHPSRILRKRWLWIPK